MALKALISLRKGESPNGLHSLAKYELLANISSMSVFLERPLFDFLRIADGSRVRSCTISFSKTIFDEVVSNFVIFIYKIREVYINRTKNEIVNLL